MTNPFGRANEPPIEVNHGDGRRRGLRVLLKDRARGFNSGPQLFVAKNISPRAKKTCFGAGWREKGVQANAIHVIGQSTTVHFDFKRNLLRN